jgi:nucleoside-diphosphate-sugar epimerase
MSGWEPRVSLEEGLARTVDWYQEYLPQLRVGAGD